MTGEPTVPPDTSTDHWRGLRRAPAWISFFTTAVVALYAGPYLYVNARDGQTNVAHTTIWLVGVAVIVASTVVAVKLVRARSREREEHLAAASFALWLVGVFTATAGPAIWDVL